MTAPFEAWTDVVEREREVMRFWADHRIFERLVERNASGPRWSFLDGPITANNPMGVHHAWGRTLKDAFQRFHAMRGHAMRYQNGFDCQGLWVEVEVEKELGFQTKRDIESFGIEAFVDHCKARVHKFADRITEQSKRLGVWMHWDDSYYTMSDGNNYAIWAFLKRCHERGLIYKGFDAMPWCPRCGTGISQHEMHEGYKEVEHTTMTVALPLREREGALLIWTTTPWTLTSNVAAAVHPELDYVAARQGDQLYYLAASVAKAVLGPKGAFTIEATLKGADLEGWTYDGPFDELPAAAEAAAAHRVVLWKDVSAEEGTGIVHIAPGCGREDFQLGREQGLPALAPIDDAGVFLPGFGPLTGSGATEVVGAVDASLTAKGVLYRTAPYRHNYPHCWRCKTELLFRLVDEWFIAMDPWRAEIQESARQVRWIPEFGQDLELDWLRNMGDWMISKKRYWGLALPIWVCESCGDFDVIGGREELKARAVDGWEQLDGHSPHRPRVDAVHIACKCGGRAKRVTDVGNPWLDAGIVPFSTMGYFEERARWEQWFPADFVVECFPGQFRNWFYVLLAMSTMLEGRAPFKVLLGHALVKDEHGEEMHKSKGNAIWFDEAVDQVGADVMRWVYTRQNTTNNLNFGFGSLRVARNKMYDTLWNVAGFYGMYAKLDGFDAAKVSVPLAERSDFDRWILSRLARCVATVSVGFESFATRDACLAVEGFVEELSNWYIRSNRRRFWKSGDSQDKTAAYLTLHTCVGTVLRLVAPMMPFVAEHLWRDVVVPLDSSAEESVHLSAWPTVDDAALDGTLERHMGIVATVTTLALSARNDAQLRVRQPLPSLLVFSKDPVVDVAVQRFAPLLTDALNVKALEVHVGETELPVEHTLKPNFKTVGKKLGPKVKLLKDALDALDASAVARMVAAGAQVEVVVDGEPVTLDAVDVLVETRPRADLAVKQDATLTVALLTSLTPELVREGRARDITRALQELRKEVGLRVEDRIHVCWATEDADLRDALEVHGAEIATEVLALRLETGEPSGRVLPISVGDGAMRVSIDRVDWP
ncbi:MAG: isoleucine--tRNA ligase [Myxococcales bacterium]